MVDGHDGTWVAHPALVPVAQQVFDAHMPWPNQINTTPPARRGISESDLLQIPRGSRTAAGLRHNVRVGIRYLAAWIGGAGCVALDNLMEDAATAEISRAQVWQWLHHGAVLEDGTRVTRDLVRRAIDDEMACIHAEFVDAGYPAAAYKAARDAFEELCCGRELAEFLTLATYHLLERGRDHACY